MRPAPLGKSQELLVGRASLPASGLAFFMQRSVMRPCASEASDSFNAMATHRVRVASAKEVDSELIGWLRQAYEKAL